MNPAGSSAPLRDMSPHLGNGGMVLIGQLGVTFTSAGTGRSAGTWCPTTLACNTRGGVQGGVFGVVLDAAMSLALHSLLPAGEAAVSVDLRTSQPLPAGRHTDLHLTGEVVRLGRTVIFATASVTRPDGQTVAFGTGTFIRRPKNRPGAAPWERNGAA
jgi:uncharacterized protein (TIGR00369 family)